MILVSGVFAAAVAIAPIVTISSVASMANGDADFDSAA